MTALPSSETIVVIGGGVAGLATAFELTKPGRCVGASVVVYQMGWRLGGKCASGRDDMGRIVEHGLHVWFGYYENAFRLLQEVYIEWSQMPGREAADWRTAIGPQRFTPVGTSSGPPILLQWPPSEGEPGDGSPLSLLDSLVGVVRLLGTVHDALAGTRELTSRESRFSVPSIAPASVAADGVEQIALRAGLELGINWLRSIRLDLSSSAELENAGRYFNVLADEVQKHRETDSDRLLGQLYDVTGAFIAGVISDVVIDGEELVDLDRFDFREWLVSHGADYASAYKSPLVKALYDTMFQYPDGQTSVPSYGAGVAAQVVLRLLGTYKGEAVWLPQASLGEALIAPLYEVLVARGVQFKFFHKLERIELTEDGTAIDRLRFARQVDVAPGGYEPTNSIEGAPCWPATPKWSRIVNGGALSGQGFDLESRWCDQRVDEVVLQQGQDFADAVLAIPLGAFKRFFRSKGPCDELVLASARFRALAENIALVPSLSVQVWCTKSLAELGWIQPKPAMVSGPQALQIWADMTQIIAREGWQGVRPASLHYFCNVFDSPPRRRNVVTDNQRVKELAVEWFENQALSLWPAAVAEEVDRTFDWSVLYDPHDGDGKARIDAQVLKANVDPCACCASSAAGLTRWRLKAGESGFSHLVLAGAWIDTGLNTECVESAVMSGMQASRAICGAPESVFGESFLHTGRKTPWPWRILTGIASLLLG